MKLVRVRLTFVAALSCVGVLAVSTYEVTGSDREIVSCR